MAVAFDAQSFGDILGTSGFTHTPVVSNPKGIVVMIAQNVRPTGLVTNVTYGGVAMTRIITATDSTTEPGMAYVYFLGSSIPTGAQTVSVTVASGTEQKTAWCISLSASSDTQIAASGRVNNNVANPSVTLATLGSFVGVCGSVFFSGAADPLDATLAAGAGYTKLTGSSTGGRDFGSQAAVAEYGAKTGANVACGWTSATDDVAMCAWAINEVSDTGIPFIVYARG